MSVRTDLPFLRARSLRSVAAAQPAAPSSLDLSAPEEVQPSPAASSSLDLSAPAAPPPGAPSASLDLGDSTPPAQAGPPSGGTSLNLFDDEPAAPPAPTSLDTASAGAPAYSTGEGGGTSLSLDAPAGTPVAAPTSAHGHSRPARHDLGLPAINADERRLLTEDEPVVELTRMQSAAGSLEAKAAVPNPSEVVLGIVFETSDDRESLVLPGLAQQGPDPRRPIFRATSSGVAVNLRRVTDIHRLLLFAVPTRPSKQMPGGTVAVTTYGGSRCEIPLLAGPTLGAQALISCYVVEGRLVLRAEHDPYSGTLQQVCAAYGYRELSWRDPYTPLV